MKFILDKSKWRCGNNGPYKLGEGYTYLLNNEGFMCCLGMFSLQASKELTEKDLLRTGEPSEIDKKIEELNYFDTGYGSYLNTDLSTEAIKINDNEEITNEKRIKNLQELFAETWTRNWSGKLKQS